MLFNWHLLAGDDQTYFIDHQPVWQSVNLWNFYGVVPLSFGCLESFRINTNTYVFHVVYIICALFYLPSPILIRKIIEWSCTKLTKKQEMRKTNFIIDNVIQLASSRRGLANVFFCNLYYCDHVPLVMASTQPIFL